MPVACWGAEFKTAWTLLVAQALTWKQKRMMTTVLILMMTTMLRMMMVMIKLVVMKMPEV